MPHNAAECAACGRLSVVGGGLCMCVPSRMICWASYETGPEMITEEAANYLPRFEVEKDPPRPPFGFRLDTGLRYFDCLHSKATR